MLTIDNMYGHGFDRAQVSRLEALGFSIRPQLTTFLGTQLCRFVDFPHGPSLELIEVEDDRAYQDFVPAGMAPYCPGISLELPRDSPATLADYEIEFRQLHPYVLHVNYDGSVNPPQPGWNYLNFAIPVVQNTFIWLTGYDEPRPAPIQGSVQPNGVEGVAGLVFDLGVENLKGLRYLLHEPFVDGTLPASGGLTVWSTRALDDFPALAEKTFPLVAIILKAKTLDFFADRGDHVRRVTFRSQPAILIETNRLSWDLVITAG